MEKKKEILKEALANLTLCSGSLNWVALEEKLEVSKSLENCSSPEIDPQFYMGSIDSELNYRKKLLAFQIIHHPHQFGIF